MTKSKRSARRPGFTGARGKPSMGAKGWDGTAADKARIDTLRNAATGTYGIVSAAAACDRSLGKVTAFTVLALLGKYRNAITTECFPSHATLARMLGIDRRSVQRHIEKLVERGYVVILPRRGARGQMSNAYVVLFPALPDDLKDEAGDDGDQPAGSVEKAELFNGLDDGATCAVAGGATLDVAGGDGARENPAAPLRHGVSDPATRGDGPCDTACRTNSPTMNSPIMNGPSAEAARETAAAADQDVADSETSKPSTELAASAEHEARQDKTPEQQARLDRLIEDADLVAKAVGLPFAAVKRRMHEWRADLVAAGFGNLDAALLVADVAHEVPKSEDALFAMAERIANHMQVKR